MASRHQARRAISLFTDDPLEQLDAAAATGITYELMRKAHLAKVAYSLLAKHGDRDSLLMLAGKGSQTKAQGIDFKSVDVEEAAATVRALSLRADTSAKLGNKGPQFSLPHGTSGGP